MVAQQNENIRATRFAQVVERIFFDAVVFDFVNVELRFSSLPRQCEMNFMAACSQVVSVPPSTVGASPWCIHRPGGGVVRAFPATPARLRRDAFCPSHAQRVQTRVHQSGIGLFS